MIFFTRIILLLGLIASPLLAQQPNDIVVTDRVLVQRCVIKGALPRMVAVGVPGGFNYAFDVLHCAPTFAWHGEFLDFSGEITGRGGYGCKILGEKQPFDTAEVPFRVGDPEALPESVQFKGYDRDTITGAPTFRFEVDGVPVEQNIVSPEPHVVMLVLRFPEKSREARFYRINPTNHLQIKLDESLRWSGHGIVEIPADAETATITVHLKPTDKNFVRPVEKLTGAQIFRNYCSACHSTDGTKLIGPTFQGLAGRKQTVIRDGKEITITTDADYLRESILKPQAAIVKGYEAVPMADFSAVLPKEQVDLLVKYLTEH